MLYCGNHKENKKGTIIEFLCPKHEDKGIQYATWYHFKDSKIGCPYCYGRYKTTDDLIKQLKGRNITI
ncbi:MAG: hypothetical protein Q4E61_03910, partial [Alphaproteobacteria bacterium]|nr:hypothetical protein [Alphaproteobacteria bacterium]